MTAMLNPRDRFRRLDPLDRAKYIVIAVCLVAVLVLLVLLLIHSHSVADSPHSATYART
jgi:hypothetical protein